MTLSLKHSISLAQDSEKVFRFQAYILREVRAVNTVEDLVFAELGPDRVGSKVSSYLRIGRTHKLSERLVLPNNLMRRCW